MHFSLYRKLARCIHIHSATSNTLLHFYGNPTNDMVERLMLTLLWANNDNTHCCYALQLIIILIAKTTLFITTKHENHRLKSLWNCMLKDQTLLAESPAINNPRRMSLSNSIQFNPLCIFRTKAPHAGQNIQSIVQRKENGNPEHFGSNWSEGSLEKRKWV